MDSGIEKLNIIAKMHSDFPTKFGIPRQSGVVESLRSTIIFEPEYRNPDTLRGLEDFSHIWIIWGFSEASNHSWSPTVRPPRLGGNSRLGVFATRSPFRPNPLGLSSVRVLEIENTFGNGMVIHVSGADLMDGSPIYDIKPYVPYADSHTDATAGFVSQNGVSLLQVEIPDDLLDKVASDKRLALYGVLAQDPRPAYHEDEKRVYGMEFAGMEIKFLVKDGILAVFDII